MQRLMFALALCLTPIATLAADAPAEPADDGRLTVLATDSLWRYLPCQGTELVRNAEGKLMVLHPEKVIERASRVVDGKKEYYDRFRIHETAGCWPGVADGWQAADFDDANWGRVRGPFAVGPYRSASGHYRSIPVLYLRGKFVVDDPAKAGPLKLTLDYQGGVVVYLNGQELTRAHLPAGKLDPMTPAEEYPEAAYLRPDGSLMRKPGSGEKGNEQRYALRQRHIKDLAIPADRLRKGVNVLAIESHRSPAPEVMINGHAEKLLNLKHLEAYCHWNRVGVADVRLSASAGSAITPAAGHGPAPEGIDVIACPVWAEVDGDLAASPADPPPSIRLTGARNGVYSGQVVVRGNKPIANLKAECPALAGPGGATVPADVRFPRPVPGGPEAMQNAPPAKVEASDDGSAVQPVWVTARVPAGAAPGEYRTTLTVSADGLDPVRVPVTLSVVDWTLPAPRDWFTHVGLWQSPDSVAAHYQVPMWSDAHWKLLETTFTRLGELGADVVHVTAIRQTHFGNEHGMIRFTRSAGGKLTPDFTIARRYLELATRHLGKVPVVCLYTWETFNSEGNVHYGRHERKDGPIRITILDPETGEMTEADGPEWGTPECRAFWKSVIDGMKKICGDLGVGDALMLGIAGDFEPSGEALDDLREAGGGLQWVFNSHVVRHTIGPKKKDATGYIASAWGGHTSHGDPIFGRGYGWKNPFIRVQTRGFPGQSSVQRLRLEALVTSRMMPRRPEDRENPDFGLHGIGRVGADFWPMSTDRRGRITTLAGRYPHSQWGQLGLRHCGLFVLAPGPDGAVHTVASEMLRANMQEIEARIFIEKALADEAQRAKLGDELAGRLLALLDARVRLANDVGLGDYRIARTSDITGMSAELYRAVAEAAQRLGAEPE